MRITAELSGFNRSSAISSRSRSAGDLLVDIKMIIGGVTERVTVAETSNVSLGSTTAAAS
jgi:hypothetical protein